MSQKSRHTCHIDLINGLPHEMASSSLRENKVREQERMTEASFFLFLHFRTESHVFYPILFFRSKLMKPVRTQWGGITQEHDTQEREPSRGCFPHLLNQKLGGWGPDTSVLTSPPGDWRTHCLRIRWNMGAKHFTQHLTHECSMKVIYVDGNFKHHHTATST